MLGQGNIIGAIGLLLVFLLTTSFIVFLYFPSPRQYFSNGLRVAHAVLHTAIGIALAAATYVAAIFYQVSMN